MSLLDINFTGRATLATSGAFVTAYNTYRSIASANGLTIPNNGFMIEEWSDVEPKFPTKIIFQWFKLNQDHTILEETYATFETLATNNNFKIVEMSERPSPPPPGP